MEKTPIKSEIWNCPFFDADDAYTYAFLATPDLFIAIYFHTKTYEVVLVKAVPEFHLRYLSHRHRFRIWDRLRSGGASTVERPLKLYDSSFLQDVQNTKAQTNFFIIGEDDMPEVLAIKEPTVTIFSNEQPKAILLRELHEMSLMRNNGHWIDADLVNQDFRENITIKDWETPFSASKNLKFCHLLHGFCDTTIMLQDDQFFYEVVMWPIIPHQVINKPASPRYYNSLPKGTRTWRCWNSSFFHEANDCGVLYSDEKDEALHCTYVIETATSFIELALLEPPRINKVEGVSPEQHILEIIHKYAYDI